MQGDALLAPRGPLAPLNGERPQFLRGHDRELPQALEVLPLVDGVGGLLFNFGGLGGPGSDDLYDGARRNDNSFEQTMDSEWLKRI